MTFPLHFPGFSMRDLGRKILCTITNAERNLWWL